MRKPTPVTTRVMTAASGSYRKARSIARGAALPPATGTRPAGIQEKSVAVWIFAAAPRRPTKLAAAAAKAAPGRPDPDRVDGPAGEVARPQQTADDGAQEREEGDEGEHGQPFRSLSSSMS